MGIKREEGRKVPYMGKGLWQKRAYGFQRLKEEHWVEWSEGRRESIAHLN